MRPRRRRVGKRRHGSGFGWGWKVATVLLFAVSLGAGARWIYRESLVDNAEFTLTRLVIHSDGALSSSTLAEVAAVEPGSNLMTLDIDSIREAIEALPLVESAMIERVFPATLEIRVSERRPVAWLSCPAENVAARVSEHGVLISDDGVILQCDRVLPQFDSLPVIEVQQMPDAPGELAVLPASLQVALDLLSRSHEHFGGGLPIVEIRLSQAYSMICEYRNGVLVTFALEDLERQLQDLEWILDGTLASGRRLATVNTMMSRNIPITFHDDPGSDPSAAPGAAPGHPHLRPLSSDADSDSRRSLESGPGPELREILRRG